MVELWLHLGNWNYLVRKDDGHGWEKLGLTIGGKMQIVVQPHLQTSFCAILYKHKIAFNYNFSYVQFAVCSNILKSCFLEYL